MGAGELDLRIQAQEARRRADPGTSTALDYTPETPDSAATATGRGLKLLGQRLPHPEVGPDPEPEPEPEPSLSLGKLSITFTANPDQPSAVPASELSSQTADSNLIH